MKLARLTGLVLALLLSGSGLAQETMQCSADPEVEARFIALTHTIRCMKCMNQSIAESPIDQARDIERLSCDLMTEQGMSDTEIRSFLADRYGDFINFKPPFNPKTWLLWLGPGLLLIVGGVAFARVLRVRMQQPLDEDIE